MADPSGPGAGIAVHNARHPGDDRTDGLFWIAAGLPTASGRNSGDLGGRRSRGIHCRTDCQDQGMPRGWRDRLSNQGKLPQGADGIRCGAGLGFGTACPDRLAAACPDGIDVYFDNLGGPVTDAAVALLNLKARVAVCGQSSQYNLDRPDQGPRWLRNLIIKRAKVQGFLVWDFEEDHPRALRQMRDWLRAGKLRNREHVVEGIENAPKAFVEMLEGRHLGKYLVRLA